MDTPPSGNERQRLAALDHYEIFGTEPEPALDNVAQIAARALDAPSAMISLVGEREQWLKARIGIDMTCSPRESSFCVHVVQAGRSLVVEDARRDPAFRDNPFVLQGIIGSYAGAPLRTSQGHTIGVLAVFGPGQRPFSAVQIELLERLAQVAMDETELRLAGRQLTDEVERRRLVERQVREEQERYRRLAEYDQLTGLANRDLFRTRLAEALQRVETSKRGFALFLLDLDHFKAVNDTLGHDAGDQLLRMVADRLGEQVGCADVVARLGGDEFALIVQDLDTPAAAGRLANRLIDAVARPVPSGKGSIHTCASIGVTLCPRDDRSGVQLLKNADLALYKAKADGRGTYRLFDPGMGEQALVSQSLAADLRRGIANGEFVLNYQPIIRLSDGSIDAFEALVRWQHPTRGLLPPSLFLPAVEESRLASELGTLILRSACRQARRWLDEAVPFGRIAVNVASPQLASAAFVEQVRQIIEETRLPADRLEVEIVETAVLGRNGEAVLQVLKELKGLGIRLSLDDFGTGYASLTHLGRLPIDRIKIDRSFAQGLGMDRTNTAIVDALIALAGALGLSTVAEGIETEAQASFIRARGGTAAQGFHFAPPLPPEAVPPWTRRNGRAVERPALPLLPVPRAARRFHAN